MNINYFNSKFIVLFFIPFSLGSLTVFSYQPFNFSIINFLILPSLFYLIVFINKKSKGTYRKKPFRKNFFLFGTSLGFGYYLAGLFWITNSLTIDESFKYLIPFSLILIPLFLSLFFSVIILLVGPFLYLNLQSIFLFSASLAFSDYVRAKILTGFPWNLWAYSFSWATELIQVLNITGLFVFNLFVVTIFTLPVFFFFKNKLYKKILLLSSTVTVLFSIYFYGNYTINKNKLFLNSIEDSFNIKVVSPNFNLEYGLSFKKIKKRLENLIRYSDPDKNKKTLFVWPEGVFSGYNYQEILELRNVFQESFSESHFILFGINTLDPVRKKFYNSLLIVNNNLEIIENYNKQKLVPFGEFLPFEKALNKFGFKKITEGQTSFLTGDKQNNLVIDKLNILPLICYEVIFTKFIQQSNKNSNLIINISEDGWFGNSIGPHQHFAKGIFRAIEHNTFLVRSTNKGISAIINNKGQIIKKLNNKESGHIEYQVPLVKNNNRIKNDLIFFILLFTYIFIFYVYKKKNNE